MNPEQDRTDPGTTPPETPDRQRRFTIRKFSPSDRESVRRICCQTGFLGNPIDPVFEDLELFADYLTAYYTDYEPESSFVLLKDGEIRGYLLGSRHPLRQQLYNAFHNLRLVGRAVLRYFHEGYNEASRKFIRWIIFNGWREVPATPRRMPHFHINLLADVRSVAETHDLIQAYLDYLTGCGEKSVFGQMVVFEHRRGERMFTRYGFKVLDRVTVTKYQEIRPEPVYLFTVVKDLTINPRLYGNTMSKLGQESHAT
jgi:hypothetical protein